MPVCDLISELEIEIQSTRLSSVLLVLAERIDIEWRSNLVTPHASYLADVQAVLQSASAMLKLAEESYAKKTS